MIVNNGFVDLFVKTTSEAAYASSLLKGKGDKIAADQAAVDKMRFYLNSAQSCILILNTYRSLCSLMDFIN